ncbi:hypothetical protein ARMSODRAFT_1056633 [Armillaria solidipes]|uniref:Uncharacterized protein n=1 Tax=Armillaria solidipes TaxID=1076256 RepID=A0A2H3BHR9_9AGAR|nr:hypothetical protein ARMSODRAFT_1056633 [Armillaria solidipes]
MSFNPSVLNCTNNVLTSPLSRTQIIPCLKTRTALVEWQSHPLVKLRGAISKHKARDWLRQSQDKVSITMDVCGARYLWIPQEQYIDVVSLTINGEVCTDVMVCVGRLHVYLRGSAADMELSR